MLKEPQVLIEKIPVFCFQLLLPDFNHLPSLHAFDVFPGHLCECCGLVHVPESFPYADRDSSFIPSDFSSEVFVQRNTR